LAAVVPGAVPAWLTLLRDHGTWPLRAVLEPAVGYAEGGVPVHPAVSAAVAGVTRRFQRHWPSSAEVYLVDGGAPAAGSLWRWPALAATWRRLVAEAEAAGPATGSGREVQLDAALRSWGEGFVADAVERHAGRACSDAMGGHYAGVLRGDDLAGWRPGYEAPVRYSYPAGGRTYDVCKCGPWSQGPVLLQSLALLDGLGLDGADPDGADFVHVVTEAMKLAYADRDAFYADPSACPVPLEVLLSPAYNAERRALIGDVASEEFRPGHIGGHGGPLDVAAAIARAAAGAGRPAVEPTAASGVGSSVAQTVGVAGPATGDTCHLDVVDRWGNMVSATPSGGWLQASPVVEGLGFPLGTRGQMFWLDERQPCALQPGKRPRTTLTPSFALRDGEPWLAFGTPGGDGQDQWQLAFFLRVVHHGRNLQEAIDSPAFHTDHLVSSFWPRHFLPRQLTVEARFGDQVVAELRRRGHEVVVGPAWSEGRLSAVSRTGPGPGDDSSPAVLRAAANPREAQGYAVGR
jgi:gamma-glutamyltranspeptidase/glutathione hydrolase